MLLGILEIQLSFQKRINILSDFVQRNSKKIQNKNI